MVVGDIGDIATDLIAAYDLPASAGGIFRTTCAKSQTSSLLIASGVLFTGWITTFRGFFTVVGTVVLELHSSVVLNTQSDDVTT